MRIPRVLTWLFAATILTTLPAGARAAVPYPESDPTERPSIRVLITPTQKDELRALVQSAMDVHHIHGMTAEALVTRAELDEIRSRGNRVLIVNGDVYAGFSRQAGGWLPEYTGYTEIVAGLNALTAAYPSLTDLSVIGTSLEGRDIYALKISDNAATDESEPEVLIQSNMHSREVITPIIAMALADSLLTNYGTDPTFTSWVDTREIWIVPTLNPDGLTYVESTDILWRKNRRPNGGGSFGVDLNRNYDYEWGHDDIGSSTSPNSETYRGPSAASEPETQVIQNFINSRNFTFAISYHSFGNLILWGPGYVPGYHEDEDIFAGYGAAATANNSYTPGNPANAVIYLVNGDSDDWAYSAAGNKVFGLTPEVGTSSDYFNPPASRIPALVIDGLDCAYVAIEHADRPGRLAPPGQPAINAIPSSSGSHDVTWSAPTTADIVVSQYEVTEKTGPAVVTDDVEAGTGNWDLDGFTLSTARSNSGAASLYSGSGNDLNRFAWGKEGYLVQAGDSFQFEAWYDIESDYDQAYVVLSTDGGRSWANLAGTGTTTADPNGTNAGNGISGLSGGWQPHSYDLSAYVGQQVWFGFRYYTDGGLVKEGIYVDDITPVQTWTTSTVLSSSVPGTSYSVSGRADGDYTYSVRGQDGEGEWGYPSVNSTVTVSGSTTVPVSNPGGFFLGKAVPNPFGGTTAIRFGLDRAGDHRLDVYDVQGRLVRTLSEGVRDAGPHSIRWDGLDNQGTKVTSGVYFYRLTTRSGAKIERTVVLR